MKRWLLAFGAICVATSATAIAQSSDVKSPGYIVIRVILEGGSAAPAAGPMGPMGGGEGTDYGSGGTPMGPIGPMGPMGGQPAAPKTALDKSVVVVVPFTSITKKLLYPDKSFQPSTNPQWLLVKNKFGSTYIYQDNTSVQLYPIHNYSLEKNIRDTWLAWSTKRNFEGIYDICTDALAAGMVDEALKYADDMVNQISVRKDTAPPTKVLEFAKAYKQISAKLNAAPTQADDAEEWKTKLGASGFTQGKHYTLVYWGERQISPEDINRRLGLLDKNFKAFYLWHALQGIALTVPDKRIVTILADRSTDMIRLRDALDGLTIKSDAFYSPANDLIVISPERMDDVGSSFNQVAQSQYKVGWSRDELLRGKAPIVKGQAQTPVEVARMMTYALVDKALEEEADHSAISREASRQLFSASGLLPRNVILPKWVDSGTASFFHHPKGPLFIRDEKSSKSAMAIGLATGHGSPNYILHRVYRDMTARKELNPSAETLLRNVITDRYFAAIDQGFDVDPAPVPAPVAGGQTGAPGVGPRGPMRSGPIGPMGSGGPNGGPMGDSPPPVIDAGARRMTKEKLELKADVTSWSLLYYLSRDRMYGMQKFYAELRRMPRDLPLDPNLTLTLFATCFNLMDKDKPTEIDKLAFKRFADSWVQYMSNVRVNGGDIPVNASASDPTANTGGGGFGGPMGPMGPMGPGGGGR